MKTEILRIAETLQLGLLSNLAIAACLGGAIGMERAIRRKSAGLRTHMLISLGAALLTETSIRMIPLAAAADPTRIPAQIVSGLGFLSAGVIFRAKNKTNGLTTAAGLWISAAIGLATGAGFHTVAIGTTCIVLIALAGFGRLERFIITRYHKVGGIIVSEDGDGLEDDDEVTEA